LGAFDIFGEWIFIFIITTIVMTCLYICYYKEDKPKKPKKSKYPDFEMNLSPYASGHYHVHGEKRRINSSRRGRAPVQEE
jgi:hypothetical protein